jgi:hypothetical protein
MTLPPTIDDHRTEYKIIMLKYGSTAMEVNNKPMKYEMTIDS